MQIKQKYLYKCDVDGKSSRKVAKLVIPIATNAHMLDEDNTYFPEYNKNLFTFTKLI